MLEQYRGYDIDEVVLDHDFGALKTGTHAYRVVHSRDGSQLGIFVSPQMARFTIDQQPPVPDRPATWEEILKVINQLADDIASVEKARVESHKQVENGKLRPDPQDDAAGMKWQKDTLAVLKRLRTEARKMLPK